MLPKSLLITAFTLGLRFLLTASLQKQSFQNSFCTKLDLRIIIFIGCHLYVELHHCQEKEKKHYFLYVEKWFYGGINRA